ncbi:MAG: GDSL-type esterase/lipase family protein, partial [Pleurocapsa sp.]
MANSDSQRAIEVYGDSISSGIAVEYPFSGVQDPIGDKSDLANAYYSYGSILAREYDAEVSLVAQAGISLVDGFSRNKLWQDIGGETIYDKVKPLQDADLWNFNNYSPDLVIIAYGQNDAASVADNLSKEEWKGRYKQMIANLRAKHPDSYFIGMFPAMFHNPQWDSYITEAIAEYRLENNDEKIFSLIHQQLTPGH